MGEDAEDHRARVKAILDRHAAPAGVSAAIASSKSVALQYQTGHADILKGESLDASHCFGIGSITKVFVAVSILQLVEEGKLKLSDTVGQHLQPGILHDIEYASTATIDQLLCHTSGVESWEEDPDWIAHGRGRFVQPDHLWTKTEPLEYLRRPQINPLTPGTWHYSNTNYTLLGLIIEQITQQTAESELRRRILEPLQMKHTYLEGFETEQPERVPCRYHVANAAFRKDAGVCPAFPSVGHELIEAKGYNMSTSWLAGGMISTPTDLIRFAFALRDGQLLSETSMTFMQSWIPATGNSEMGHGLFRMVMPESGAWIGHSGGVLGFSAGLWWHEEKDCAVCVLGNLGVVHTGGASMGVKAVISDPEFLRSALQAVQS